MKIIKIHTNYKKLIKKVLENDTLAQKQLYDEFAPKMLGVCRQYIKDHHFAEDVMIEGFLKVFKNLKSYHFKGSFEGWIRRIMVHQSISFLRKNNALVFTDETSLLEKKSSIENDVITDNFSSEEAQILIDKLPNGYKIVFNLYAIEGYKHQEIAEKLSISVSTSKSQLFKARKLLQKNYLQLNTRTYGK